MWIREPKTRSYQWYSCQGTKDRDKDVYNSITVVLLHWRGQRKEEKEGRRRRRRRWRRKKKVGWTSALFPEMIDAEKKSARGSTKLSWSALYYILLVGETSL